MIALNIFYFFFNKIQLINEQHRKCGMFSLLHQYSEKNFAI